MVDSTTIFEIDAHQRLWCKIPISQMKEGSEFWFCLISTDYDYGKSEQKKLCYIEFIFTEKTGAFGRLEETAEQSVTRIKNMINNKLIDSKVSRDYSDKINENLNFFNKSI